MAFEEFFFLALRNLRHRRTRSLLTMIGIFIGIAAVVSLISLGAGLQNAISAEFQKMGADKITVMSGGGGMGGAMMTMGMAANPLTEEDVRIIKKTKGISLVGGMLYKAASLEYKGKTKQVFVIGYPLDENRKLFEETQLTDLDSGRTLRSSDKKVALLGAYAANELFDKKIGLGETVKANGEGFRVVGILKTMGNRMDDSSVFISLEDARDLFDEPEAVLMILAQVAPGEKPAEVAERVEKKLRKHRDQKEGEEDFSVSTSEQLLESFGMIFGVVQAVIIGIAGISLLVGGIGIMNTMYTSVLERTREIGVMKAVGAKNRDIMMLFLIESGMLGLVGGVIGVLIGAGLAKTAEFVAVQALGTTYLQASLAPELIIGALLFSFAIGAFSGVLPARHAAQLKPVDALRYE